MKKNNRGFSLFELMIVISLIAIVSSIVVPNLLSGRERRKIQAAAENLVADIQIGRMHAMRSGSVAVIIEEGSYRIFTDLNKSYDKDGKDELIRNVSIDDTVTMKNITFPAIDSGTAPKGIYFNNKGMVENFGVLSPCLTIAAKINNKKDDEREVCVNRLGRVWIKYHDN